MTDEPPKAVHPTIYYVVLGRDAALRFEAEPAVRETYLRRWCDKARALGKRSVEVMGPYCRLVQVEDL